MRGSYHRIHRMTMLDDSGGPALPFAQLQLDDPGYPGIMPLLERVSGYIIRGQERLPDGTFCRPEPEPTTVWADDLFMSVPFLLRMARITEDPSLYDEVALQVIQFNHYLQDPQTGLYFHGWYNQRQEHTPVRWGRANGWVVWATSEALMHLPDDHPRYGEITGNLPGPYEGYCRLPGCLGDVAPGAGPSGNLRGNLVHSPFYPWAGQGA